jgi:hypothetical protein
VGVTQFSKTLSTLKAAVTSFFEVAHSLDNGLMGTQESTLGHLLETRYPESNDHHLSQANLLRI